MGEVQRNLAVLAAMLLVFFLSAWLAPSWWLGALINLVALSVIIFLLPSAEQEQSVKQLDLDSPQQSFKKAASDISLSSSHIAIDAANLSHFMDRLTATMQTQVERSKEIVLKVNIIEKSANDLSETIQLGQKAAADANADSSKVAELITDLDQQRSELVANISITSEQLRDLKSQAESITSITDTINQLAEQTNLLALNAAIEAARAGDQGRGFSVVADEVRSLAHKTAEATHKIESVLTDVTRNSMSAVDSMEKLKTAGEQMSDLVLTSQGHVASAHQRSADADAEMRKTVSMMSVFEEAYSGVASNVAEMSKAIGSIEGEFEQSSSQLETLSHQTEDVFRHLHLFDLDDRISLVDRIAIETAHEIAQLFESAIQGGELSESALFDTQYQPVPNTNPQKFKTLFDDFTDRKLPSIQEPILDNNNFIIYAGAVDRNGYFPTHNNKFAQPVTGDYEIDLMNSRTKRIFNDYTGARCGSNTQRTLLQTYKRDTGEVMHDLSAPIYVNGKHWGGFRIGFKAE